MRGWWRDPADADAPRGDGDRHRQPLCRRPAIVLRDSAHLQEEESAFANEVGFSAHRPALRLYDATDVERTLELVRPVPVHDRVPLEDDVWVTLRPAGQILGSATCLVEAAWTRTSSWAGWVAARRLLGPCVPCMVSRSPPRHLRAG